MRLSRLEIARGSFNVRARPAPVGEALLPALTRAAFQLTPVVIDFGQQFPRLGAFVDSIESDGDRHTLVLGPVSADAIPRVPGAPVTIQATRGSDLWVLTAERLHASGSRMARVELAGASLAPLARRRRARTDATGREPLVLAVPSATEDLDGCVFPLSGLGASHCIVDASVPLQPGAHFDPVEVIGNRRILRRAAATVLEVIPWIEHDGARRFRCRLLLESSEHAPFESDGHDLLCQRPRIQRLLELACMLRTAGYYHAPGWPRSAMRFEGLEDDRLIVALEEPPPQAVPPPVHVYLGCELFAVSYQMQVRPLARRGHMLEVSLPLVMRRQRRRREQRAHVPPEREVWVNFRSPATGLDERRPVRDLSFGGLCFEADPGEDVLWPGIVLEDVTITMPDRSIRGGDIEVRGIDTERDGTLVCHCANRYADRFDDWALASLLGRLKHPDVEIHDGSDFQGMVGLYRRAGLLAPFIERNLDGAMPGAAASWQKLHDTDTQVGCTFVHRDAGEPLAAFSGVRAWERTWLAQHFASAVTGGGQITGALHLAYLDFVLPRSDAHYSAFFVRAENHGMHAFYKKFAALAGTDTMDKIAVDFWIHGPHPAPYPLVAAPYCKRPMCRSDEETIAHAAERTLGRQTARALSFEENAMTLPFTDERFKVAGLRRRRQGFVVTRNDQVVVAVLGEQTSPGVNLTFMLNAWWLLPVHGRLDQGGRATSLALDIVLRQPAPVPGGDRFVITLADTPGELMTDAGFEKLATVYLYVLSRSGLHRYYQYVADRYGEVHAAVTRRQATRLARQSA
jgi:hypothetical protein